MRKTKIVCTLGPASYNEKTLTAMLKAGMNVARINVSHGDHATHLRALTMFRHVRDELQLPAAVLLDTKGPEIRLGDFEGGSVELITGSTFTLTTDEVSGTASRAHITYAHLPSLVKPGDTVLIDDGRICMSVIGAEATEITCLVNEGGTVSGHKGINVPHVHLDMPYLSDADQADLLFGVENDVDFIAASFVRTATDVTDVRKFLDFHGGHSIKIIAKIENTEGIDNFDAILAVADGIMVARGDMGVEVAYERLPGLQKKFIRRCYSAGKMVITATQMLESMIAGTTPTRAEITDVANAVFDGTSAVMLSGETAIGRHPALVVATMARIAEQAEYDAMELRVFRDVSYDNDSDDTTNAICDAACTTARDVGAAAIIAVTATGYTARRVSKFRPSQKIVAATYVEKTYHQLSLSWGVYPVRALFQSDADVLYRHAVDCARCGDYVQPGDRVVITAGTGPLTDTLRVHTVPEARQ